MKKCRERLRPHKEVTRKISLYLLIRHFSNWKHTPESNFSIVQHFSWFIATPRHATNLFLHPCFSRHPFLRSQMASASATTLFSSKPVFPSDNHSLSPSPTIPKSFTGLCKPFHSRVPTSIPFFRCRRPKFFVRATVSVSASPSSSMRSSFFFWGCLIVSGNAQVSIFP